MFLPAHQNHSDPESHAAIRAAEMVCDNAARAFWTWSQMPGSDRTEILHGMAEALVAGESDLIEVAASELGASPRWTRFNVTIAVQTLQQATTLIPLLQDHPVMGSDGNRAIVRRQPAGVVLGFAPWNAPITLSTRAIAAPIACGNSAVLKASELCPRTHTMVVDLFSRAGLPDGVVSVVNNKAEHSYCVARALIRHPAVRRINFTGSTRVGQIIAHEAADVTKRCLLELSGKASMIVLEDADLDVAAASAMVGAFFNQGQVCMSTERIVVLDAIADDFVARLVAKVAGLRAEYPCTDAGQLGRLVSAEAAQRVRDLVQDAVRKGATLLSGGQVEGAVMQPVVLDYVTPRMRIYGEENFGPVASIIRVRDEDEAISVANDTEYGLSAAVFGADEERCMKIAGRLETGICQINGSTVHDDPTMPFGGVKSSGYGRFGGLAGMEEFTELRWISIHTVKNAQSIEEMLT